MAESKILNSDKHIYKDTVYGNYCKAKRVGNVVQIYGRSVGVYEITNSYKSLTTLGEIFRPTEEIHAIGDSMGGNSEVMVQILPSGIVQLYCSATTKYWQYNITYIVD